MTATPPTETCPKCGVLVDDCEGHVPILPLPVEEDYPASAWDIESHDYGPKEVPSEEHPEPK